MKWSVRNEFLRNTLILIFGTGLGQAIPFFLQPILRRIYSTEDFGAFAIYFSIFSSLVVIANFRYDIAIGAPESDKEGANLLFLTGILNFLFNSIIVVILFFLKNEIAIFLGFPEHLSPLLFLLPASMFFFSLYQSINYWLIRKAAFRAISSNKITRRGAEGLVQLGFGMLKQPSGLFWGDLLGNFVNTSIGILQLRRTGFSFSMLGRRSASQVASKYWHFPKYGLVPHLLGTIAMQVPVFIINRNYSKIELGLFDLTQQALIFPFSLVTIAVAQVFMKKVADLRTERQPVLPDFNRITLSLAALGIFSLVIIAWVGPELFAFVFGSKWSLAGDYARILIFGYIFFLIVAPLNAVLISLEKIKTMGLWNLVHFCLMAGLGFIPGLSFPDFLKLLAGFQALSFCIFYILILSTVLKYDAQVKSNIP